MGYICVISKANSHHQIDSDFLPEEHLEDNLMMFSNGDDITFRLEAEPEICERLIELQPIPGVKARKEEGFDENGNETREFFVVIGAVVVGKVHTIEDDWMQKKEKWFAEGMRVGLRASEHALIVQCKTDEAQDVYLWIRKKEEPAWAQAKT